MALETAIIQDAELLLNSTRCTSATSLTKVFICRTCRQNGRGFRFQKIVPQEIE